MMEFNISRMRVLLDHSCAWESTLKFHMSLVPRL